MPMSSKNSACGVNWTRVVAELDNRSFTILYLSIKVGLGIRFELKDIEMRVLCCLLWGICGFNRCIARVF